MATPIKPRRKCSVSIGDAIPNENATRIFMATTAELSFAVGEVRDVDYLEFPSYPLERFANKYSGPMGPDDV